MNWKQTGSGLYVPEYVTPYQMPTCIDLFCGCGGFSLGFMQAGWHVIAGLDNEPAATITYCHNLGTYPLQFVFAEDGDRERLEIALEKESARWQKNKLEAIEASTDREFIDDVSVLQVPLAGHGWIKNQDGVPGVPYFFFGDVRKFTGQQILDAVGLEPGELGAVIGGPPCQGFSRAGKQDVMDPRNSLVFEFARLVIEMQPKTMVMENVPEIARMVTPEGMNVADALCHILADGGFAEYDALKRALSVNEGKAVFKDRKPKGESPQMRLFQ